MDIITINYQVFAEVKPHGRREKDYLADIQFVTENYSAREKLCLFNIPYEAIVEAKKEYEQHFQNQLISLLKRKIIEPAYGTKFNLNETLVYLELPYKSSISFKRYLKSGNINPEHVLIMLNHLADEYRTQAKISND